MFIAPGSSVAEVKIGIAPVAPVDRLVGEVMAQEPYKSARRGRERNVLVEAIPPRRTIARRNLCSQVHASAELAEGLLGNHAVEDQLHPVRPPQIRVVTNDLRKTSVPATALRQGSLRGNRATITVCTACYSWHNA